MTISNGGCEELEHHFDTVEGSLPNCSASHFPVLFFSARILFNRFISFISFPLKKNDNKDIENYSIGIILHLIISVDIVHLCWENMTTERQRQSICSHAQ